MQQFSLHTHTLGFDGHQNEEQMMSKAVQIGFKALGISNHFIVHPKIKEAKMYAYALKGGYQNIYSASFAEALEKFKPHYDKIDEFRAVSPIPIYKGMEVDFFSYDGWRQGFEEVLKILKPDYIIGSAHFVDHKNKLNNVHDLKNATKEEQNLLLHRYWQNIRATAQSGLFDFMAHLDLPKKCGVGQSEQWKDEEIATIETLQKSGVAVELNTSYFKSGILGIGRNEPYPGPRIMKLLAQYKIPVLISDDAHDVARLGDHFKETEIQAKKCGITKFLDLRDKPLSTTKTFGKFMTEKNLSGESR